MTRPAKPRPVFATLTVNPSVDVSASVERVVPERKLRCQDLRYDPGGGGINVARVLRRLGGEVVALYAAGGANGGRLKALLDKERIASRVAPIAGETREDLTAFDLAAGDQYRFILPGPRLSGAEWRGLLAQAEGLTPQPSVLVASGSLPLGAPADFYGRLARRTRSAGGRLALDASGPALQAGLDGRVWLAKPNLNEMEALCGAALPDEARRLAACRALIAAGSAQFVALSLGHEGAMLVTADGAWAAAALPIIPVSVVGAGDSFLAGLVWALAAHRAPAEALSWAVAAASATLLSAGTGLGRRSDVLRLRPQVQVRRLA